MMGFIIGIILGFFLGLFLRDILGRLWFFYLVSLDQHQRKRDIDDTIKQLEDHANNED